MSGLLIVVDAMVMAGCLMHQWIHNEDLIKMSLLEQEI